MHTLSKRLQHEEEKDDLLMQEVEGTHKKKKLGEVTAVAISNPPLQMMQSGARSKLK